MSVFLDTSNKRKFYFRGGVIFFSVAIASLIVFFAYSLLFGKAGHLPPIKYADTIESYHYYYSAANKKKVALTFDDGPRPEITRELMTILKENNAPGMFFFIGQEILLQPKLLKEVADQGFDIGNHSFTHQESIHNTPNRLALELRSTNYLISKVTGKTPIYYRPPFLLGIGVDPTINPYIQIPKDVLWSLEQGLVPTGVDIDPKDWLATGKDEVIERFTKALDESPNGHIVLLHEEKHTVEALPQIIGILKERGYEIVSFKDLLTPPRAIALTQDLRVGSTDESSAGEVSQLQWFLYSEGDLDPYLLTGTFDRETEKALFSFQLKNKLIDPNNIDPRVAGVVNKSTRELIATTYEPTKVVDGTTAPTMNKLYGYAASMSASIVFGYVNFIPFIRQSIIWMTKGALGLVIFRCLFILGVLLFGWLRKFRETDSWMHKNKKLRGASILVPAYNEQENIRGTIESLLKSTYAKKEIIVIDDGSTDNTSKVVEEVIKANPTQPIKLLRIPNGGKANALNHGIEISRYEVCIVIDADAVLHPKALHYFMPHFRDESIGAVAGRVNTTTTRGFLNTFQALEYAMGQNIDKTVTSTLGCVGVVPGPAGAWRKKDVIDAGGFSTETLVEDQDMTLTILRMGKRIIYEPRAISYTETPDTIKNFLKQRFRWIYGTIQCFWKHKGVFVERPGSTMSLVIMPNIFIFNILLPLTYPFADIALIAGAIFGEWQTMVFPFLLFTLFDILYAGLGVLKEKGALKMLVAVPLQRVSYRQLIYYTVIKSVVRAIEGTGSGWNKFRKTGETQRFYFTNIERAAQTPVPSQWMATAPIPTQPEFHPEIETTNSA